MGRLGLSWFVFKDVCAFSKNLDTCSNTALYIWLLASTCKQILKVICGNKKIYAIMVKKKCMYKYIIINVYNTHLLQLPLKSVYLGFCQCQLDARCLVVIGIFLHQCLVFWTQVVVKLARIKGQMVIYY